MSNKFTNVLIHLHILDTFTSSNTEGVYKNDSVLGLAGTGYSELCSVQCDCLLLFGHFLKNL